MNRYLTSRLAARARIRQVEIALRADAAAAAADRAILRVWRSILGLFDQSSWHVAHVFIPHNLRAILPAATQAVYNALARIARYGRRETVNALRQTLPTPYLRHAATRRLFPLREDINRDPKPGVIELALRALGLEPMDLADQLREPAREEMEDERQREIFTKLLFPPPTESEVHAIITRPVSGVTWTQRLDGATRAQNFTPQRMAEIVSREFSQGKAPREIAKALEPVVDGFRSTAQRIARTEGMRVAHDVQHQAWEAMGTDLVIGYQLHATLDQHSRSWHAARNGKVYYREPKNGQSGFDEMPRPPLEPDGSVAWNCYPGNTVVQGAVGLALRAWYSGQVVEIVTAGLRRVTVTPNHPVLTKYGFVRAGTLTKGDYLVGYSARGKSKAGPTHNVKNSPMTVEKVFRSFQQARTIISVGPRPAYLHGDAQFIKGEIEVVGPNRKLLLELAKATATQSRRDLSFSISNCPLRYKYVVGSQNKGFSAHNSAYFASTDSFTNFSDKSRASFAPHEFRRFGSASCLDARLSEPAGDDIRSDAKFLADLTKRFSSFVAFDEIVSINRSVFRGHVYDLQSPFGFIVGNDLLLGNCRCHTAPVLAPADYILNDPAKLAVFQTADDKFAPDAKTYSEWFDKTDDRRRRMAVGARRYSEVEKAVGKNPKWENFIDPDSGDLLSLTALKSESHTDRVARVGKVRAEIEERGRLLHQVRRMGFVMP